MGADSAEVFLSGLSYFEQSEVLSAVYFCEHINTVGVKMDRSWRATLSPRELASLQALRRDAKREFSASHRQVLLAMGLIKAVGTS